MSELDDIRSFVAVVECGGFGRAAKRLGLAKSIVSRRVARLEAELGTRLLSRTTRGISPTEAGLEFKERGARILNDLTEAREAVAHRGGEVIGRLRVSVPLSFGVRHVAPVLAELAARHPRLEIDAAYSDRFVDLVTEGYDCAIRVGYLQDSNLIAKRVGPIYGKLVASPDYIKAHGAPETPEDLAAHEALMQGTESWQLMDGDNIITVRPQGRFKADNGVALVAAAAAGLGIAYLPDCLTHEHIASGALMPVMTRHPPSPAGAYVVRAPGQHPARKIRVLTELLIEYCDPPPPLADVDR